jgi:hypothetical protein
MQAATPWTQMWPTVSQNPAFQNWMGGLAGKFGYHAGEVSQGLMSGMQQPYAWPMMREFVNNGAIRTGTIGSSSGVFALMGDVSGMNSAIAAGNVDPKWAGYVRGLYSQTRDIQFSQSIAQFGPQIATEHAESARMWGGSAAEIGSAMKESRRLPDPYRKYPAADLNGKRVPSAFSKNCTSP